MAQPRDNVQAPQARPPIYGLIAAAPVVEDAGLRWVGGWRYLPEGCGTSGRLAVECAGNTEAMVSPGRGPGVVEGEPVLVYAGDECSTFGFAARDWLARARRQLTAVESFELAAELWGGDQLNPPQLATPGAPTSGTADTGGTLVPGTYSYRISAVDEYGETLAGAADTQVVPAGTNTNVVTLTWTPVAGADGYNVYGRDAGTELLLTPAPLGAAAYTDTGAAVPAGALPAANTTGYTANRVLAGPAADSDTVTTAAADPIDALACLTQGLAETLRGQQGMVHVTPQLLTYLQGAQVITRQGNLWVTGMGHIVVADAGYTGDGPGGAAAGASQWAYATPVVQVRLGPVETAPTNMTEAAQLAQATDRDVNTMLVFAYRLAGFQWTAECAHLAAEVALPLCAVGGVA